MTPIRIAHLTSVHSRYDTRIFLKQCRSLAANGYQVTLIVADDQGDENRDDVTIISVGKPRGRIARMSVTARCVLLYAMKLDADIYHLHDPELLPIGLKLKRRGKRVVFDAHEDVPKQILSKPYLWAPSRSAISGVVGAYEAWVCRRLDAVVTATPFIRNKFLRINPRSYDINNYPLLGELETEVAAWKYRLPQVCYVGAISSIRGIREIVRAMEHVKSSLRLALVGKFSNDSLAAEVRTYPGWTHIDELGWLDRQQVATILGQSIAGIVTFLPAPNHFYAQPNKMFEYMSAGIPVITSNFPLWREIVEGNKCGICVDPLDPVAIGTAIDWIATHGKEAQSMGENGKRAVAERYNWAQEERKLLDLYRLLSEEVS